eukprot:12398820-Karenia_brevis.AAC.1
MAQAETVYEYPMLCWDFKEVLRKFVIPLVFATGTLKGFLLVGMPNRGKTVLACSNALCFGRYHVRTKHLPRLPSFRRGKQFDVFRAKPGEVQEGILIDDPSILKIDVEDLKSFGDTGKAGHSDCRYTPVKWAKNQYHALLSNEWNPREEPDGAEYGAVSCITWEQFHKMIKPLVGYSDETQTLAVLKRFNTIIAGKNAMYVRPFSDCKDTPIFRFTADNIADDWLIHPGNKSALNSFERGEFVKYDNWDVAVQQEQDLFDKVQSETRNLLPDDLVSWWVALVRRSVQKRPLVVVPATPDPFAEDPGVEHVQSDADGMYRFHVPAVATGSTRRSRFRFDLKSGSSQALRPSTGRPSSSCASEEPWRDLEDHDDGAPMMKKELLDDDELASIMQAQQAMSFSGPIDIQDTPPRKHRRQDDVLSAASSSFTVKKEPATDMDDEELARIVQAQEAMASAGVFEIEDSPP